MSNAALSLLARTAVMLLANGQTTEGAHLAVERLGRALGTRVRFRARWGEYMVQTAEGSVSGEAVPTGVDMDRVVATEAVVDAVCACGIEAKDGLARLDAIGRSPPVALPRFVTMAAAGAAALGVISGSLDWQTLILIAASAGCGALARRAVSYVDSNPFLQPFIAALIAGLFGGIVARLGLPVSDRLVVLCPCMVLVPGPHFLNGSIDLARVRIPIGAGRISFALLIVFAICGGLLTGLELTGEAVPQAGASVDVPLPFDMLAAGIAVAAYGSFFNMPWHLLPVPIFVGMSAHAVRWELIQHGSSLQLAAFVTTLLVGTTIAPLAHLFRLPFGASAFASIVSLIPGIYMFDAASATLAVVNLGTQADPASLLPIVCNGATALVVVASMTSGLIFPKMIFDILWANHQNR